MADQSDWADEAEQRVLDQALALVPSQGWTRLTARAAGAAAGLSAAETELLLPRGAEDLAALFWRRCDKGALAALGEAGGHKIRERIARAVEARTAAAAGHEAASRRLLGFLALPQHLALGAGLVWASADALWRWAGDTASDENHYSKRAILAGVLGGALALRLNSGPEAAERFAEARIGEVMAFETWKAGRPAFDPLREAAVGLARLRYRR